MEFPVTIDSQESFDEIVKERLARVKTQYADYDDLKSRITQAEADKAAAEKARDEAITAKDQADSKLAESDAKQQVATWRADVAKATGVPAEALAGSSKEEFEAHAAILKPLMTPQAPIIPTQGQAPESHGTSDERAVVRQLFGGDE